MLVQKYNVMKSEYIFALIVGIVFVFVFFYIPIDNLKFFFVPMSLSILALYFLVVGTKEIRWHIVDVGILFFLVWAFLSVLWATNPSRAWYGSFIYVNVFLFVALMRNELMRRSETTRWLHAFFLFLFLVSLAHHILAIHLEVSPDDSWNAFLIRNKNYTTSYMLALLPFLVFYPFSSRLLQYIKFISLVLCFNVVLITHSRGGLLALSTLVLVFIAISPRFAKFRLWAYAIVALLVIVGVYLFNRPLGVDYPVIQTYCEEIESRIFLLLRSIELFMANPIGGVGMSNLSVWVYATELPSIVPFDQPNEYVRLRSHNQFSEWLAEGGLFGFLAIIIPLGFVIIKSFQNIRSLTGFELASLSSLLIYLVTSYFYCTVNAHEHFFSSVQYLGWFCWGVLMWRYSHEMKAPPKAMLHVCILIGMVSSLWFGRIYLNIHGYWKAQKMLEQGDNVGAITLMEGIYHPHWYSHYDFEHSLAHHLARLHAKKGAGNLARRYYSQALDVSPHDMHILVDYADFLRNRDPKSDDAKRVINTLSDIDANYNPALWIRAEYAFLNEDFSTANALIQRIKNPTQELTESINALESMIASAYLQK